MLLSLAADRFYVMPRDGRYPLLCVGDVVDGSRSVSLAMVPVCVASGAMHVYT